MNRSALFFPRLSDRKDAGKIVFFQVILVHSLQGKNIGRY